MGVVEQHGPETKTLKLNNHDRAAQLGDFISCFLDTGRSKMIDWGFLHLSMQ